MTKVSLTPPALVFSTLIKISIVNPYLKIFVLAKLFVADAPIKKKFKTQKFTPSQITLKYGSKNRPRFEELRGDRCMLEKRVCARVEPDGL